MTQTDRPAYPRLPIVAAAIVTVLGVLGVRLAYLGTAAATSVGTGIPEFPLHAQRGSLWDRGGDLVATERYVYSVFAAPHEILDPDGFAIMLAPHLGQSEDDIADLVNDRTQRWVTLSTEIPMDTARYLESQHLSGLHLQRLTRRSYLLGRDAAHLTGFVDFENRSHYGIEERYDDLLRGRPGSYAGNFGSDPRAFRPPLDGADLVLTIDRRIQAAAATALRDAIEKESAAGGTIIVLEPSTGAILASSSWPSYEPDDYANADPEAYRDPAVSTNYEPGSVLKAMTVAAALDANAVQPGWTYDDEGSISVDGMVITNWDGLPHGTTTVTKLLQHSLNVGAVHLAQALGPDRFYRYLAEFGFGSLTGVDLANEAEGLVRWPGAEIDWYPGNLATNSFGQGIASTPLQVAAAMAAIANDGRLMRPHAVAAVIGTGGEIEPIRAQPVRQVVSAATARRVREMLADVVSGRVTQASVPGHSVGGKTGTSQIPTLHGYEDEDTIASFAGFLPVSNPRLVIFVKIDRPASIKGSEAAAPVFRTVARHAIDVLGIAPDQPIETAGGAP